MNHEPNDDVTPPGVVGYNHMRVNRRPEFRFAQCLGPAFYIIYGVILYLICIESNHWVPYIVAFFYFYGLLSAVRAFFTWPLRIPPMFSLHSLACMSPAGYENFCARVSAANTAQLQTIRDEIDHVYGPYLSFRLRVGTPQICQHCEIVMPMRTYHCNTCHRCVYRLDHHSKFLGQCVHYRNAKFVTLTVLCHVVIFFVIMLPRLFSILQLTDFDWYLGVKTCFRVNLILDLFMAIKFFFDVQHLRAAHLSYTKNSLLSERNDLGYFGSEDLRDWLKNAKASIGEPVWTWFVPISGVLGEDQVLASLRRDTGFPAPSNAPGGLHKRLCYFEGFGWRETAGDKAKRRYAARKNKGTISDYDENEEVVDPADVAGPSGVNNAEVRINVEQSGRVELDTENQKVVYAKDTLDEESEDLLNNAEPFPEESPMRYYERPGPSNRDDDSEEGFSEFDDLLRAQAESAREISEQHEDKDKDEDTLL